MTWWQGYCKHVYKRKQLSQKLNQLERGHLLFSMINLVANSETRQEILEILTIRRTKASCKCNHCKSQIQPSLRKAIIMVTFLRRGLCCIYTSRRIVLDGLRNILSGLVRMQSALAITIASKLHFKATIYDTSFQEKKPRSFTF